MSTHPENSQPHHCGRHGTNRVINDVLGAEQEHSLPTTNTACPGRLIEWEGGEGSGRERGRDQGGRGREGMAHRQPQGTGDLNIRLGRETGARRPAGPVTAALSSSAAGRRHRKTTESCGFGGFDRRLLIGLRLNPDKPTSVEGFFCEAGQGREGRVLGSLNVCVWERVG